jgi:hypothetical protein
VLRLQTAPVAVFFKLDFALDKFLVLVAPVVDALAFVAGKFYEAVLGHRKTIPHNSGVRKLDLVNSHPKRNKVCSLIATP